MTWARPRSPRKARERTDAGNGGGSEALGSRPGGPPAARRRTHRRDHLADGRPKGRFHSTPYSCTLVLMSSASESACSRDGEGDTELDLEVNILPRWGCPRAGRDAGFQTRAGARAAGGWGR